MINCEECYEPINEEDEGYCMSLCEECLEEQLINGELL